jgi:hypothetical protein
LDCRWCEPGILLCKACRHLCCNHKKTCDHAGEASDCGEISVRSKHKELDKKLGEVGRVDPCILNFCNNNWRCVNKVGWLHEVV